MRKQIIANRKRLNMSWEEYQETINKMFPLLFQQQEPKQDHG
jgi:hypothetical protein